MSVSVAACLQASMEAIKERYGAERKEVEGLKERAATMAGAMAAFCERMGYKDLEVLISRFQVSAGRTTPTQHHASCN